MAMPRRTQSGDRYGLLTAINPAGTVGKGNVIHWLCRCACGNNKVVNGQLLRRGSTKSCGCIKQRGRGRPAAHISLGLPSGAPPPRKTDGRMWVARSHYNDSAHT